jgi:hypothetical protein
MRKEKQFQAYQKHNKRAPTQSSEAEPNFEIGKQQEYSDDERV